MALVTWACTRIGCGARNLEQQPYCTTCSEPKPRPSSFRQALAAAPRIPPQDLEDFCRRYFARGAFKHQAEVHLLDGEVFLTLTPATGDPCVFLVDENDLTPCDTHGRPSW